MRVDLPDRITILIGLFMIVVAATVSGHRYNQSQRIESQANSYHYVDYDLEVEQMLNI